MLRGVWNGRFLGGVAALACAALLLAGCGAAGPGAPSAADPTRMAPADTVIYLSLAVRPQGAQARQINQTLQKLGGGGAEQQLRRAVAKLLRKTGANYSGNVKPWLGQRLGIVFTQPPSPGQGGANAGVALIAPTSNPSAARSFVHQLIRHNPHTQGEVSGGYAVFGGALAYQAILATTPGNSLATTAGYRNTTGQLPAAPAALLYLNLNRYAKLARASATGALGATNAFAGVFKRSLSRFGPNAAVAAGVSLTPSAIRLDTVQVGARRPAQRQRQRRAASRRIVAGRGIRLTRRRLPEAAPDRLPDRAAGRAAHRSGEQPAGRRDDPAPGVRAA